MIKRHLTYFFWMFVLFDHLYTLLTELLLEKKTKPKSQMFVELTRLRKESLNLFIKDGMKH